MSAEDVIDREQLGSYLKDLEDWRLTPGSISTVYECATAAQAIEFFGVIAAAAELDNHHPNVDWRYNLLFVSVSSHDAQGQITTRDVALASKISEHARALEVKVRTDLIKVVEVAIDTDKPQEITQLWATALGYEKLPDGSLVDPHRRAPSIWFQETQTPNPNRLHLDVYTTLEDSGKILDSLRGADAVLDPTYEPSFTVVTDQQGNRLCICTDAEDED